MNKYKENIHSQGTCLVVDNEVIQKTKSLFNHIQPFSGIARSGRNYNFVGALLPQNLTKDDPKLANAGIRKTIRPNISDGEVFAEWYSTHKSIDSAKDSYLMISFGAHIGGPVINAYKYIQAYKPMMQHKYIAVEADEHMCEFMKENFIENKIDLDSVSIIQSAMGANTKPVLFASSKTPFGFTQVYYGNDEICKKIKDENLGYEVSESLIKEGTTKIPMNVPHENATAELKMVSSTTVSNVIGPHELIDYLEIDIQGSEYHVLPLNIDLLNKKVRWIHLGTHCGYEFHKFMRETFLKNGWEIDIDWLPESTYQTPNGEFETSDGVLSMQNTRFYN